jgi:DNA-binding CsgD family transcriptional regulator
MFDTLLAQLVSQSSPVTQRPEGVAFFKVAKDLYRLANVTYVCVNISVIARRKHYTHCFYSDTCVRQFMSPSPLRLDFINESELRGDPVYCEPRDHPQDSPPEGGIEGAEKPFVLTLSLRERCGETAVFGVTADMELSEWRAQQTTIMRECRILANYFHGHVLRINGHDSEGELLISARELDCLKWTAAGKTAWEASVILGISERTVRYHLDIAREKLKCATTTQAVAKAVASQLIDVR